MRLRIMPFVLASTLIALAGCGKDDFADMVQVEGTVALGEKPIPFGIVVFVPDKEKGNASPHEPRGVIEAGRYKVYAVPMKPGVPPGAYKVYIRSGPDPALNDAYAKPPVPIPVKYNAASTSGLTIDAKHDTPPETYNFKLKP